MKRIITSIVECPACDSKNIYGDMDEDTISIMLIHCYDCGILITRGADGTGTSVYLPIIKGECGHGIAPQGDEYDVGKSKCNVCNRMVKIKTLDIKHNIK
jgi:Zn ribbon nucleic-acid-binding protein